MYSFRDNHYSRSPTEGNSFDFDCPIIYSVPTFIFVFGIQFVLIRDVLIGAPRKQKGDWALYFFVVRCAQRRNSGRLVGTSSGYRFLLLPTPRVPGASGFCLLAFLGLSSCLRFRSGWPPEIL